MKIKFIFILIACLATVSCSSSSTNPIKDPTTESMCDGPTNDLELSKEYTKLFKDSNYSNGFKLGSTDESTGVQHGVLDYGGTASNPVWLIAQWNNIKNDLLAATYNKQGAMHTYATSGGNKVVANNDTGELMLQINTTSEYGLNGITNNPRRENEPWPTLLLEYSLGNQDILKVSDKTEIRMAVLYNILHLEDHMTAGTVNADLHSAQFQWFVTVQNRNASSPDFGKYIWFGLSFFDKRYDFTPFYAKEDGGKENNTGAFIYMPAMKEVMGSKGKTEIGKDMCIDTDILPLIKEAFQLAQERSFLTETKWDELYIGSSNIGWEVTGTYNVSANIKTMNIYYK